MKRTLLALLALAASNLSSVGQTVTVMDADQDSRILEIVDTRVNAAGATEAVTNRVVEVATSMHYWDGVEWSPSSPDFEIIGNAAVAAHAPHVVSLNANLNVERAVTVTFPDGQRFAVTPLFLAFRSTRTGQGAVIGQVQDSTGVVIGPNLVLYTNAMAGVSCSVLYENRIDGMEQNLLVTEPLNPLDWGVPADGETRLELWSEVYEAPPGMATDTMAAEGLPDLYLHFGSAQIGQGRSFLLGQEGFSVPVGKSYGAVPDLNGTFLVETVTYESVKPIMDQLQQQQAAAGGRSKVARTAKIAAKGDKEFFAQVRHVPQDSTLVAAMSKGPVALGPGLVLDFRTVNGSTNNAVFQSDWTYSITGDTTLAGSSVTFEAGTVLKYASGVKLTANCPIVWQGTNYAPVTLTAANDHSVGEKLNSNAEVGTNRFAKIALEINATTAGADAILRNFRIRNAEIGILLNGRTGHDLVHGQFVNCGYGVVMSGSSSTLLRNGLFNNVTTNLSGSTGTVKAEQITSDGASYFKSDLAHCFLTNSLLVAVTTVGTFENSLNVQTVSSSTGVFATVGSASHYLASNTYRNLGSSAVSILAEIQRLTTVAPVTLSSAISVDTTLSPQAQRDTDLADLGYHYDPLDYVWSALGVTATLTMTSGVAVATYGPQGATISGSGKLISQGRPDLMNHLVRYNAVQEQPALWGSYTAPLSIVNQTSTSGPPYPEVRLRFTEISLMGSAVAGAEKFFDMSSSLPTTFVSRDSLLRGVWIYVYNNNSSYTPGVYLTNNILLRPILTVGNNYMTTGYPLKLEVRNNLLIGGTVTLTRTNNASAVYNVKDNVLDTVTLTASSTGIGSSYNGYKGTTVLPGTSGNDIALTTLDYQVGPLGKYYYNTTSSATNTAYLINKDSASSAGSVGLYHYTTRASDQAKDGASAGLDLGFHYIVTSALGSTTPLDTDGDGVPDYLEDINGDGTVNSGETDWNSASDLGLRVRITEPKATANLP